MKKLWFILLPLCIKIIAQENHISLEEYGSLYNKLLQFENKKNDSIILTKNTYARLRQELLEELLQIQSTLAKEIKDASEANKINQQLANRLIERLFAILATFSTECPPIP